MTLKKIKLLKSYVIAGGVWPAGSELEIDAETAETLIERGIAQKKAVESLPVKNKVEKSSKTEENL